MWDTSGRNPYGRVLAFELQQSGWDTNYIGSSQLEWVPSVTRARCWLPYSAGRSSDRNHWFAARCRALWVFARAIGLLLAEALVARRLVLLPWCNRWFDVRLASCIGRLGGSIAFVIHNPIARSAREQQEDGLRQRALSAGAVGLVHSERLARKGAQAFQGTLRAVAFPSYASYVDAFGGERSAQRSASERAQCDLFRIGVGGTAREDKGMRWLERICAEAPADLVQRSILVAVGRAAVSRETLEAVQEVGWTIEETGEVTEGDFVHAIQSLDVLIAPYDRTTTMSSVVAVAVACRTEVLAFDVGDLGDYLPSSALVGFGEVETFVERLRERCDGRSLADGEQLARCAWEERFEAEWAERFRSSWTLALGAAW